MLDADLYETSAANLDRAVCLPALLGQAQQVKIPRLAEVEFIRRHVALPRPDDLPVRLTAGATQRRDRGQRIWLPGKLLHLEPTTPPFGSDRSTSATYQRADSAPATPDNGPVTDMTPSSPDVSRRMSLQLRAGTSPERALRTELHRRGRRFRVDFRFDIDGLRRRRADVVFTRFKVAVFVDGCFWHRCPEHATFPKANQDWWAAKLAGNVARDRDTDDRLGLAGWSVVRVWEHEDARSAADRVEAVLDATRKSIDQGCTTCPDRGATPARHKPRGDSHQQRLKGEA